MAICVPNEISLFNKGEEKIYKFVKNNFDDDFILYHNNEINGVEFDFLLLDKNSCLYVIEVKDWTAFSILCVEDKNKIKYKNRSNEIDYIYKNPIDQARSYKFKIINYIKKKFGFNPKVVHLVCYPNMSLKDFNAKRMDIVSGADCTILNDDLDDKESFLRKIKLASNQYYKDFEGFSKDQILKIRSMFENINMNNYSAMREIEVGIDTRLEELKNISDSYSIFIYINQVNKKEKSELINKLISLWKNGSKIQVVSKTEEFVTEFWKNVKSEIIFLQNYKDFKIENGSMQIFNLSTYCYSNSEIIGNFVIIDGKFKDEKDNMADIGRNTTFNFEQYQLEHLEINKDIMVKAGAGSGKTYSMISRITYLIYKHRYTPEEVVDKLYLITFTNDAANNMKDKLRAYFMNYYLLTRNQQAFLFIESISKMRISTIHSLSKLIIDKFSTELELGCKSNIIQGKIDRYKIIDASIDKYMKQNHKSSGVIDMFEFRTFEIRERISLLLEKLEQKNILIDENYDWGENYENETFHELIKIIVQEVQQKIIEEAIKNDQIRLSQLILFIKELLNKPNQIKNKNLSIDYLFVDEFQDTDDVQIDIMKQFQEILNFNLFIVGDIKQCIYRFRGAKDDAFDRIAHESKNSFEECKLTKNYRSDKGLLEKLHPKFKKWGNVENLIYNEEDKLIGVKEINYGMDDFENILYDEDKFESEFINKLTAEINRIEGLYGIDKKPRTIAVLVRNNYQIDDIRKICNKNHIFVEADVNDNLYDLPSTHDLYALVLALKNNRNLKCLYNLFETSYTRKTEDRTVLFSFNGDNKKLLDYYKRLNPIDNWDKYLEDLKTQPVMKVIRQIIFDIKPWEIYASEWDNKEKMAIYYKRNLEQLLENIIKGCNNNYLTINKLCEKLRVNIFANIKANSREELVKQNEEGINIICRTVHRSKGLEYDTVIFPYCNLNINEKRVKGNVDIVVRENKIGYSILKDNPYDTSSKTYERISNNYFEYEQRDERLGKLNEEVRILYVALTRAISKVVYFSVNKDNKKEEIRWQDLLK